MTLNVYTIFSKIDGCSDQLIVSRSDERIVHDFVNSCRSRNDELAKKNYPLIQLDEYELRKVATFDDVTSVVTALPSPVVVPLVVQE